MWDQGVPILFYSLSKYHGWCQYHKSMSIGLRTVKKDQERSRKVNKVKSGQYGQNRKKKKTVKKGQKKSKNGQKRPKNSNKTVKNGNKMVKIVMG